MTLNLKSLKQQTVLVGDVDNVRSILEKQRVRFMISFNCLCEGLFILNYLYIV